MILIGRSLLILFLLFFSFQLLSSPNPWIFIDYLNLLIHEAGHLILLPFGQFIHVLGGSTMQIFIPCLFFGYFLRRQEFFSVSFTLFWIADNIINVAAYMKDAIPMSLPLLGGDNVIHDWNYLFSTTHLLPASYIIGQGFFILGVVFLIASIIGMVTFTFLDTKK